jgi:hypothetical protein
MFHLSLLWRMSVSKHPYFKEVSLGPHEEVLRRMLLEARPGEPDQPPSFSAAQPQTRY